MANQLTLNLLKPQDFFNAYYWQSPVKNEDEFAVIVAEYLQNLEKSKHQSEKAICANVLKPFFERLNFNNVNSEYVLQGVATNSAIDLALIKDEAATVIIEAKKQDNKEMITRDNANKKALHEAILYYFRERENGNLSLRFIIISNFYDFYIFRANEIEHIFYKNKKLAKLYRKVVIEKDTLFTGTTKEFYEEAEKIINSDDFINGLITKKRYKEVIDNQGEITSNKQSEFLDEDGNLITAQINCFYLNLAEFKTKSRKAKEIIKLFSREFLYGEFSYDPNKISKKFYEELLYILGLKEEKSGNLTPNNVAGSLFKNIENSLHHSDFDTIMQLIILWLNRLLFLKLIETNLINFNANGDKALNASLKFLNQKINDFDTLNTVFFDILAKPIGERLKSKFDYLPYLNSNIFQKQEIEKEKLSINQLHNEEYIEFYPHTTLLDENRKKRTGKIKFLDYLFQFLDAFDFGEIKTDEVSGSLKTHSDLISSAVLGQVFEKLNGYKDGSFYTPSFITEYMSKQSIDNLVLQRFSQKLDGYFDNIADLAEEIQLQIRRSADKQAKLNELNAEIDNLKICDPAVGSGYFLVSALNYLIALKSQLGLLTDENGRRLNANIAYEFDELVIKNYDDTRFHYTRPQASSEPQHIIQKTLFQQKAHIIENCLFGVDINPNSCEIARLRLWIELLKSAYFTDFEEQNPLKQNALETLPNIDINIKCGNSLVSYFAVNEDIKISDKKAVEQLKEAVKAYKTGNDNKEILLKQIKGLQEKFRSTAFRSNNKIKQLQKQCAIYSQKYSDYLAEDNDKLRPYIHKQFFVEDFNEQDAQKDFNQLLKLHDEIFNLDQFNPFEWRFEFPEVLDEDGNFTGFDLMIANPPYISAPSQMENEFLSSQRQAIVNSKRYDTLFQKWDLYIPFIELGISTLCKENGICAMIVPYPFTNQNYATKSRQMLLQKFNLFELCDLQGLKVFDAAVVTNCILFIQNQKPNNLIYISKPTKNNNHLSMKSELSKTNEELIQDLKSYIWNTEYKINHKKHNNFNILGDFCYISVGMVLNADEKTAKGAFTKADLISNTQDEIHSKPYIEGKDLEKYRIKRIRYLEYDTERVPNKLRRPTFRELYTNPKVLINALGNLKCSIDLNGEFYCEQQVRMALLWKDLKGVENKSITGSIKRFSNFTRLEMEKLSENTNLKFILGILNSQYGSVLLNNIRCGEYHILPEHIRNIPIPQISTENQTLANKIIDFVEQILHTTDKNQKLSLMQQIDQTVYQLYGLTDEEIKIIEQA